jgi:hypothetical protein
MTQNLTVPSINDAQLQAANKYLAQSTTTPDYVGGQYNATKPTLTDGGVSVLQVNAKGSLAVAGGVAAGATDSGEPIKFGAVYNTTLPTYTTGQRTDAQADSTGTLRVAPSLVQSSAADAVANTNLGTWRRTDTPGTTVYAAVWPYVYNGSTWDRIRGDTNGTVTQPYAIASSRWVYAAASGGIANTTTAVTVAAAGGAAIRNYVTSIQIDHDTLGAVTEIAIRDGAAGTVLWRGRLQTAAKEGTVITFPTPLKGTANTLLEVVTLTAVTGAVYVNVQGFTGA